MSMRIPTLRGLIKRRILVNFRADPETTRRLLPQPLLPKIHRGHALVGICLIRLERIRPVGVPAVLGIASENAAHRISVEWMDEASGESREGVFIARRDTGSRLNHFAGGRLFPGEHHFSRFDVQDDGKRVDFTMRSSDGATQVRVIGEDADEGADALPPDSCFASLEEASAFFRAGSLGYSVTSDPNRLDGLLLQTRDWRVRPLNASLARSSFYDDESRFPKGTIAFDHVLIMRNIEHRWLKAQDFAVRPCCDLVASR